MSRFNTRSQKAKPEVTLVTSPMGTTSQKAPDTRTYNGAAGWAKTPQTELFLRLTSAFSGNQKTFYEDGAQRDDRLIELTRQLVGEDPDFVFELARWSRTEGNIRTGAIMVAAEFVKARLDSGAVGDYDASHSNRAIVDAVCQRPDEPGEFLAYWTSRFGRTIPKPVKRGLADAVRRMYNGKSLLKYDTQSKGYRFGDILNLVHAAPDPDKPWQGDLFQYALDRRHSPDTAVPPESNRTLMAHKKLAELPVEQRRALVCSSAGADLLGEAGMTWESLAGWLQGPMDKAAWEAIIPSMGVMALVRNLRNFDQAGVSDEVAARVAAKISDPAEVARSRQLPFRYLAAYQHAPSLRWAYPLEQALGYSLANVPVLPGRTLILVDRSGSMFYDRLSDKSQLTFADAAAVFGTALAVRAADADLVEFGTSHRRVQYGKGESVLKILQRFSSLGGTNTVKALHANYAGHDRVIIVTDEQYSSGTYGYVGGSVPESVPMYTWNLKGYAGSHAPSGTGARFTFGGLTDKAFGLIPPLEAGKNGIWPWKIDAA